MPDFERDVLFVHGASKAAVEAAVTKNKMWAFDEETNSIGVRRSDSSFTWLTPGGAVLGTENRVAKFGTGGSTLSNSRIIDDGYGVVITDETDPVASTGALDIYGQGCGSNQALNFRQYDVGNAIIDYLPADAYGSIDDIADYDGGLRIIGSASFYRADNKPLEICGFHSNSIDDITVPYVTFVAAKCDGGTGLKFVANTEIAYSFTNKYTSLLQIYGSGQVVLNHTAAIEASRLNILDGTNPQLCLAANNLDYSTIQQLSSGVGGGLIIKSSRDGINLESTDGDIRLLPAGSYNVIINYENGNIGDARFTVVEDTRPQMSLVYDSSNTTTFKTDSSGNCTITTSGSTIFIPDNKIIAFGNTAAAPDGSIYSDGTDLIVKLSSPNGEKITISDAGYAGNAAQSIVFSGYNTNSEEIVEVGAINAFYDDYGSAVSNMVISSDMIKFDISKTSAGQFVVENKTESTTYLVIADPEYSLSGVYVPFNFFSSVYFNSIATITATGVDPVSQSVTGKNVVKWLPTGGGAAEMLLTLTNGTPDQIVTVKNGASNNWPMKVIVNTKTDTGESLIQQGTAKMYIYDDTDGWYPFGAEY